MTNQTIYKRTFRIFPILHIFGIFLLGRKQPSLSHFYTGPVRSDFLWGCWNKSQNWFPEKQLVIFEQLLLPPSSEAEISPSSSDVQKPQWAFAGIQRAFLLSHMGKKKQLFLCRANSVLLRVAVTVKSSWIPSPILSTTIKNEGSMLIPRTTLAHHSANGGFMLSGAVLLLPSTKEQFPTQPS